MEFTNWDTLLYGIHRGECILFLGPDLPLHAPGADRLIPARALADRLLSTLDAQDGAPSNLDSNNLARIAQRFLAQKGEIALEREVTLWHQDLKSSHSAVHEALAVLPFHWIITTSHDPLIDNALRREGKTPAVDRYHYEGAKEELLPDPASGAPVLFHLYGHVDDPRSLVVTEMQLLDLLAAIISKNPPLPNNLNAALTNSRQFLFLGFGLEQWYLRILFHVLKVLRHDGFAPDAGRDQLPEDAIFFYRENTKIEVCHDDVLEFVRELGDRYNVQYPADPSPQEPSAVPEPAPGAPTVFLCHASEDEDKAREIHDALVRSGLNPWLDKESLRGGDHWDELIESTIKQIDYFVVLNSRSLVAKSGEVSYVTKEIKLALRAEDYRWNTFIIPARIDETPLLDKLTKFHAVDLTQPGGTTQLIRAIKRQQAGAATA